MMGERLDEKSFGVSGALLKWVALLSMLLDHVGYVLLPAMWSGRIGFAQAWDTDMLWQGYLVLRRIGRPAFPLYLFLLAEGFAYSRSRGRYLLRLGLFALLSEIPFDLAFGTGLIDRSTQNVFFTLLLGLAALTVIDAVDHAKLPRPLKALAVLAAAALAPMAAKLLCTDYGAAGVAALELQAAVMFLCRRFAAGKETPPWRFLRWSVMLPSLLLLAKREWWMMAALPLVMLYDGRRGKQRWPWLFYVFYPAHLLLLYFLRLLLTGG